MKKETAQKEVEYIPFGEEWMKEMRKLSKEELLNQYRNVCITLQNQRDQFLDNMFK